MERIPSMTAFATVVTSGSFAAAARRLNISPAMVTNHVHALEGRLGARLLNRTTRTLSLTEAGRPYFEKCTLILPQLAAPGHRLQETFGPTKADRNSPRPSSRPTLVRVAGP